MLFAVVFLFVGGLEAVLIRIQLATPNSTFLSPQLFNQLFTMHGTTMVFLVGMPVFSGFANYLIPLMIGADDVAFPRLNALSFWMLPFGAFLLHFSFLAGAAPDAGWFSYAPLSTKPYSSLPGIDYWILSIAILGIGSIAGAINIVTTVLCNRAAGDESAARTTVCVDHAHAGNANFDHNSASQLSTVDVAVRSVARGGIF